MADKHPGGGQEDPIGTVPGRGAPSLCSAYLRPTQAVSIACECIVSASYWGSGGCLDLRHLERIAMGCLCVGERDGTPGDQAAPRNPQSLRDQPD
eukprot:scaffold7471_cov430-Prasinococcus_capsulatus_cf.AAC.5